MKRWFSMILALVMLLAPAACADKAQAEQNAAAGEGAAAAPEAEPEETRVEWRYRITVDPVEEEYKADDGTLLGSVSFEIPHLSCATDSAVTDVEPPREMQAVCSAFNEGAGMPNVWANDFDIETEAREQYEWKGRNGEFAPLANELRITDVHQEGNLLSIRAQAYCNLGGAYPDWGWYAWNFDLANGAFFTLSELTDDPEGLHSEISWNIIGKLWEEEVKRGAYYDNFEDIIMQTEEYRTFFGEDGLTIWFDEYEIAPFVAGVPEVLIPYAEFGRYLNQAGEALLSLSDEEHALSDYYAAEEMWYWLEGAVPLDDDDVRYLRQEESGNSWDAAYYRVDISGVTTLAGLRERMLTRFSAELTDQRIDAAVSGEYPLFKEFDGVLYSAPAGRGEDMYVDSVDYAAQLNADKSGGEVVATIHWRDYDEETEEWHLTGETDDVAFPFVMTETGACFTEFRAIY